VGSKVSLNAVDKSKISCPCQQLNVSHPAHSLLLDGLRYPGSDPVTITVIQDSYLMELLCEYRLDGNAKQWSVL
jgi:hypothetical protein